MFSHVAGEMQVLGFWHSSTPGAIFKKKATSNETKKNVSSKGLYKGYTIAFGNTYMVNILNNHNISKIHWTSSESHYNGVFLFGRRPDRVIEMACFDSKLQ